MRKRNALLLLVLLTAMLVAAPMAAADAADALGDCTYDGRLDSEYSTSELREAQALAESRADIAEYYDCQEVLDRALLDAAGRRDRGSAGGAAPSGGGGAPPTGQPSVAPPAAAPQGVPAAPTQASPAPAAATREDVAVLNRIQNRPPSALADLETAGLGDVPWKAFLLGIGLPISALLIIDAALARRTRPVRR